MLSAEWLGLFGLVAFAGGVLVGMLYAFARCRLRPVYVLTKAGRPRRVYYTRRAADAACAWERQLARVDAPARFNEGEIYVYQCWHKGGTDA